MPRLDGRSATEMRPVRIERGFMKNAEGSCLVSIGETKVICTATVEDRVPPFLKNSGKGWVTAEYAMIPRSCRERTQRETKGAGGRTMEIQRLIGRSLRAIVDTDNMGERTILIDCDVLGADGGTRTAAITGASVALADAVAWMEKQRMIKRPVLQGMVAAISVGVVNDAIALDLCYEEDSKAAVDMNVVMTDKLRFVEVQGTGEGMTYDRVILNKMLDAAQFGIQELLKLQREAPAAT